MYLLSVSSITVDVWMETVLVRLYKMTLTEMLCFAFGGHKFDFDGDRVVASFISQCRLD